MPTEFVIAASTGDLSPGEKKMIQLGKEYIMLANVDGSYFAVDVECTHAYAFLSMGPLDGEEVTCPLHGAVFNVKTGKALTAPAQLPLMVYQVKVDGDDILIGPPKG